MPQVGIFIIIFPEHFNDTVDGLPVCHPSQRLCGKETGTAKRIFKQRHNSRAAGV